MSALNVAWRRAVEKAADARPDWANGRYEAKGVPTCSGERCHRHDGKRCEVLGYHPGRVCEPVVTEMGKLLNQQRTDEALKALQALVDQVARTRRGLHTGNCATVPQEIIRRGMDRSLDGHDEPQFTEPGKCNCGAMAVAAQVDAVLSGPDEQESVTKNTKEEKWPGGCSCGHPHGSDSCKTLNCCGSHGCDRCTS